MSKSLNRRKDVRTTAEFERDIVRRTLKERFLARLFVMEMRARGSTVSVDETGNKDAGKVTARSSCESDYEFTIDGELHLVDIKNCGISTKATFKLYQLKQYVKQEASILLFVGTGFIDKDPTQIDYKQTQWALVTPHHIQYMIEDLKPYKDPNFGYKQCVRVTQPNFHKYFVFNTLVVQNLEYFSEMDLNST